MATDDDVDSGDLLKEDLEKHAMLIKLNKLRAKIKPLIEKILKRKFYSCRNTYPNTYPEWNIKVYSADYSGKSGDFKTNSVYDKLWDIWVEKHKNFFWDCCEDGLGFAGEEKHRLFNWNEGMEPVRGVDISECSYKLSTAGRSSGHMVLESFDGQSTAKSVFEDIKDNVEYIPDMNENIEDVENVLNFLQDVDIKWLKKLVVFMESLDSFNAEKEWNAQCNYRRNEKEERWDEGDFSDFDVEDIEIIFRDNKTKKKLKAKFGVFLEKHYKDRLKNIKKEIMLAKNSRQMRRRNKGFCRKAAA